MSRKLIYLTGKGRGRQVIAVARTADLVVMMLDATKGDKQRSVHLINVVNGKLIA